MKANKVTVTIVVEALSIDCLRHLAEQAIERCEREFTEGTLAANDGDTVTWSTKTEPVSF